MNLTGTPLDFNQAPRRQFYSPAEKELYRRIEREAELDTGLAPRLQAIDFNGAPSQSWADGDDEPEGTVMDRPRWSTGAEFNRAPAGNGADPDPPEAPEPAPHVIDFNGAPRQDEPRASHISTTSFAPGSMRPPRNSSAGCSVVAP